jgi:hypothetical protein
MTNQSFDSQVKQKIHDHESTVPPGVWESIEQKKKKRRYPFFWWLTGIGILVIGITITVITMQKTPPGNISESEIASFNNYRPAKNIYDTVLGISNVEQKADNNPAGPFTNRETSRTTDLSGKSITTGPVIGPSVSTTKKQNKRSLPVKSTTGDDPVKIHLRTRQSPSGTKSTLGIIQNSGKSKKVRKEEDAAFGHPINLPTVAKPGHLPGAIMTKQESDLITSALQNKQEEQGLSLVNEVVEGTPEEKLLPFTLTVTGVTDTFVHKSPTAKKSITLKSTRWSVDISISPFLPLRQIQALSSVNRTTISHRRVAQYTADTIKTSLQPSFAYTVALYRKLGKRLIIGAGIQYGVIKEHLELKGIETNTDYHVVQRLENGSGGPFLNNDTIAITTSGIRTIDAINSYRFFDIPLYVHYMLVDKGSLSLRLTGGINLGLYSHYNNSIAGDLQVVDISGNIAHSQRAVIRTEIYTGFRLSHQLSKRSAFFAEPYLRFNMGKYGNTKINNRSVHQVGLGVGMEFQIGAKR